MHNTSSTRKASNGRIVHNTIERHNRETIVNFEQKYNNKLHLSSFLRKWHIFISTRIWCLWKNCWKIIWDDSLKQILIKLSSGSKVFPYLGKLAVNSDNLCICHIFLNVNRMYKEDCTLSCSDMEKSTITKSSYSVQFEVLVLFQYVVISYFVLFVICLLFIYFVCLFVFVCLFAFFVFFCVFLLLFFCVFIFVVVFLFLFLFVWWFLFVLIFCL